MDRGNVYMRRYKLDIRNSFVMPDLIRHPLSALYGLDAQFKHSGMPVFTGMTTKLHLVNLMSAHMGATPLVVCVEIM